MNFIFLSFVVFVLYGHGWPLDLHIIRTMAARMPLLFLAHGAPNLALEEDDFTRAVRAHCAKLEGISAIAVVSAHWQQRGAVRVNAVERPQPIYDFGGFSPELYEVRYDAPGSPALARDIVSLLLGRGIDAALEASRGWDHGVWVPLRIAFPAADIPIVEISLPFPANPQQLLRIGRALAPLRERDVLIVGSGGIVHNLRVMNFASKDAPPEAWAVEADGWVAERVQKLDADAVAAYRSQAPNAALAAPTPEHFEPLFIVLGAAADDDRYIPIYEGFHYATLSMRTFALG